MEIRSYRRVFDLERRVYSIDRLRLNPGGVPLRSLVYLVAILLAVVAVGSLPLMSPLAGFVPWYVRDLAIPVVGAGALGAVRIDGRTFHIAARARLRYWAGPRHLSGLRARRLPRRWRPEPILLLPDGSDGAFRRVRYTGPGAVLVARAHTRESPAPERGDRAVTLGRAPGRLTVRPRRDARPRSRRQVIVLTDGVRLKVDPTPRETSTR